MAERLGVSKKKQKKFFKTIKIVSGFKWSELSMLCGVSERALRDWARGKYTPSYESSNLLGKKFGIALPAGFKILDSYWYIKKYEGKGALARQALYGLLGDRGTRRKGGLVSQQKRREEPEKYRLLGCNVKKDFQMPPHSEKLAELMGIIMGDGSINNYQVRITLSKIVDRRYAYFVRKSMEELLGEKPYWMERESENTIELVLSGAGLVEVLEKLGLKRGDKVRNQIDFPKWIKDDLAYRIACVRGLFDTDGGFYIHKKKSGKYLGWCFANHSMPILREVEATLKRLGLIAKRVEKSKLYMYSAENISRYMKIVNSHNPKNIRKFKRYI